MPKTVREIEEILREHGWSLERTVGSHRQYTHPDKPECGHRAGCSGQAGRDRYAVFDPTCKRDPGVAMTEYLAIYERNDDGWWAYVPDLPGCTATGDDREEVERNAREAVIAHVELLRSTGRVVPDPTTHDISRIAV